MKNFLEKVRENGPAGRRKDKTERATGLGRRTREEIAKWNQIRALRFQTGGRHQTSPASLLGVLKKLKQLQLRLPVDVSPAKNIHNKYVAGVLCGSVVQRRNIICEKSPSFGELADMVD